MFLTVDGIIEMMNFDNLCTPEEGPDFKEKLSYTLLSLLIQK